MSVFFMSPAPGERAVRFVGDRLRFALRGAEGGGALPGWRAVLRTNLGRASTLRDEIIKAHFQKLPLAGASWHDIPMSVEDGQWVVELPLPEAGFFKAKAYAVDPNGWQHWPDGPDFGVSVHPSAYRTANTIYCAFPRLFGATKNARKLRDEALEKRLKQMDDAGYTVIPLSGKLRDLTRELPHIIGDLGCRIVHLLPINPTPTTLAKMGRFGSPYAGQDLTAIDPALVDFDKRTTGIEQFCELTCAAHRLGGRVFLDLVVNHTGWGATLFENHPEWYQRKSNGEFASPGAWGTIWGDLVELDQRFPALWEEFAEAFLTWCRRGVDGFRCDAGYMVPTPVWQYIVARVQREFPDAIFLLEGLGGAWEATENLMTVGGMQWAYSELFQNYNGLQVSGYLDHSLKQSQRVGVLVNYSETHDNNRLAATSRAWALLRNRLCALTSVSGGYGFTCGVEWLADERIQVHQNAGLCWGALQNIVPELAQLNTLLADHPCFFDGAKLTRLSPPGSQAYALLRESEEGKDAVLALVNTDVEEPANLTLALSTLVVGAFGNPAHFSTANLLDLLGQTPPEIQRKGHDIEFQLAPGAAFCLSMKAKPAGLSGEGYRRARAQAAFGLSALRQLMPIEAIGNMGWMELAQAVDHSPASYLAAVSAIQHGRDLPEAFQRARTGALYPRVVVWHPGDERRITMVPPGHWLLVVDAVPFRAKLETLPGSTQEALPIHVESIVVNEGHAAYFPPRDWPADTTLSMERFGIEPHEIRASIRFLAAEPVLSLHNIPVASIAPEETTVLLTNGRGGMARMGVELGHIRSKYDCVLGVNFNPTLPVDRHVFVKRVRAWLNADGFITPLNGSNLVNFTAGPPARWRWVANAGDGRSVEVELEAWMIEGRNTTALRFHRLATPPSMGRELPDSCEVHLTVRFDIEDRNFHWETKHNGGSDYHFNTHCRPLVQNNLGVGFEFTPAADRHLRVFADSGRYFTGAEWSDNIPHPIEASRGQEGAGDAFSPGWFDLPLQRGGNVTLLATAELGEIGMFAPGGTGWNGQREIPGNPPPTEINKPSAFARQLALAARSFVVKRGEGKTVIAGYPWFLDWGRDTLICVRGLIAAGFLDEVREILITFARFEMDGTLPNTIHGEDASNRDTTDAPLWFGVACEEFAAAAPGPDFRETIIDASGRTVRDVLRSIAVHYIQGTANGIQVDADSGLVWSPSHFTWMDTNYPAGTPREGYPVEIQALWIRLLRQLSQLKTASENEPWDNWIKKAEQSLNRLYWIEADGYFADVLLAKKDVPARSAIVDHALRSNCLILVSLGLVTGENARRCVAAAQRYLIVPGALRSLAPLPANPPIPIHAADGRLLNDPALPYWPRYEGDEDTRRKPAYHNGTAWTWTFPHFCEALARAWDCSPEAVAAARSYLGSTDRLMMNGCLGQLPEITDGDAPHQPRGCDAQAWSATEALRVWSWLEHV